MANNSTISGTYRHRLLINVGLIAIGVTAMFFILSSVQREVATDRIARIYETAMDKIVGTLDGYSTNAESLQERYHTDNQAILSDMRRLVETDYYSAMLNGPIDQRNDLIKLLSARLDAESCFMIMDTVGNIVSAERDDILAVNAIQKGILSMNGLRMLMRSGEEDG